MQLKEYPWKRFWCRPEGRCQLTSEGYLLDPEGEHGQYLNPDVVSFEKIAHHKCLILLGEPGIGKSYAIRDEIRRLTDTAPSEAVRVLDIDLRAYGSEDHLVRDLFEDPRFGAAAEGQQELHIFLDSLDECRLLIPQVAVLLAREFGKYPRERLHLRIACRTAVWPPTLERDLRRLWGDDNSGVFELMRLLRKDVERAASTNNIDPGAFVEEIERKEVVPLAVNPVTLDLLIRMYSNRESLPDRQTELYRRGCLALCEDSPERIDAGQTGMLSDAERVVVASRIAAVTLFSRCDAVWTQRDPGDVPDTDVLLSELRGHHETCEWRRFFVDDRALREALNTGLFTSRGGGRMGWMHQSYEEFLAANYLIRREVPLAQVMSLLRHPGDSEHGLVPQLHGVAAWLANMRKDVFEEVMSCDPAILLRSDTATANPEDRASLVASLLSLYGREELLDADRELRSRYWKLDHAGLADQVAPYIRDRSKGRNVRGVAISIAGACKLQAVHDDLVDVALDPNDNHPIRAWAAMTIARVADPDTKCKLKPLATGQAGEDPDDELKGAGLIAVWPDHMTADEAFSLITPPKQPYLYGAYQRFLSHHLPDHLSTEDLPTALDWLTSTQEDLWLEFGSLADQILRKSLDHFALPGVPERVALVVLRRLEHSDPDLHQMFKASPDRRDLVAEVVRLGVALRYEVTWLAMHLGTKVTSADVPWMLERLAQTASVVEQGVWASLLEHCFAFRMDPAHISAIIVASGSCPALRAEFRDLLEPVELDSLRADELRARYRQQHRWDEERPILDPPPRQRVLDCLGRCEAGAVAAWWQLNRQMTLEPDSTEYGSSLEDDLTQLPGWRDADEETRLRIVRAAKWYTHAGDPNPAEWLGTNKVYYPAYAGYRALRLVMEQEPDFIDRLPAPIWRRWAPIIVGYITSSDDDCRPGRRLVGYAYRHALDEVIRALLATVDHENASGHVSVIRKFDDCLDERLAQALLAKLEDPGLTPDAVRSVLEQLLDHSVPQARRYTEALVPTPPPVAGNERERAIVAASVLMTHTSDAGWSLVWPAIQADEAFGDAVLSEVAWSADLHNTPVASQLTEGQLADLYIWMERKYPRCDDLDWATTGRMGRNHHLMRLRDIALGNLKCRGTAAACDAMRRIMRELPELQWLKYTLYEAQHITRERTWEPPSPQELLKMISDRESRLVRDGNELLQVVVESLHRLQRELNQTTAIEGVWDEVPGSVYRPKREEALSNHVKLFLDRDLRGRGIVANREVQIRRGQRTDIHIDAIRCTPDADLCDTIAAIIEVKGCWADDLQSAMATQLVDRYLKETPSRHGIYLVAWFSSPRWDASDVRQQRADRRDADQLRQELEQQAAHLSQGDAAVRFFMLDCALDS
jgi:hypothetical protein